MLCADEWWTYFRCTKYLYRSLCAGGQSYCFKFTAFPVLADPDPNSFGYEMFTFDLNPSWIQNAVQTDSKSGTDPNQNKEDPMWWNCPMKTSTALMEDDKGLNYIYCVYVPCNCWRCSRWASSACRSWRRAGTPGSGHRLALTSNNNNLYAKAFSKMASIQRRYSYRKFEKLRSVIDNRGHDIKLATNIFEK